MKKSLNALGYHIYAGGFTVGVQKHFNVVAHLEHSNYGVKSAKMNFPKLPIYVKEDNWPSFTDGTEVPPKIDLLYGNPPCAAFSIIGKHKGANDPRLYYHEKFQDLIKVINPNVAVLESVQGLLKKGAELVDDFCQIPGYAFYIVKHDAQYLGVPQCRKRVFLVASKYKIDWFARPLTEPIACKDAIKGIKKPKGIIKLDNYIEGFNYLIPHTKQGESMEVVFDRYHRAKGKKLKRGGVKGGIQGRPSFCIVRNRAEEVSGTITGYPRVHPTLDRWMNINEYKALCSYPQDYELDSTHLENAARQLTRAVMPGVGEWLAYIVKRAIQKGQAPNKIIEHVDVKPSKV
jgi:DNA (cytosine-5)-methyltransferase 1